MNTETIAEKADRLLTDGRVHVRWSSPEIVGASVRGDTSVYDLGLANGRWWCSCPVRGTCSHLLALWKVTVPTTTEES